MKVNTRMIKNMDSVFIHGQIKGSTKGYGLRVNNMHLECIMYQEVKESMVYGKMEKELNGLMIKQQQI